jgi:hypothetical protein
MKITAKYLKKIGACSSAQKEFEKDWPKSIESIECLERLMKEKKPDWANWLITRLMKRPQYLAYAIFAAEQVIEIYEKKYPEDSRPRKAIETTKAVLKKDNKANRKKAAASAAAAYACAAASAAAAAAYAAADSAEKEKIKILQFGIKLLRGKNEN